MHAGDPHRSTALLRRPTPLLPAALAAIAFLLTGCDQGIPGVGDDDDDLIAIVGALVYTSPLADPIEDGTVVVLDGVIEAVGPIEDVRVPGGARRVDASGMSLLSGFWNADVWIDEEVLALAESGDDEELSRALEERFTRFGFTSVVDTGSEEGELAPLLERLRSGEVVGPRVFAAGGRLPAGVHQSGWWYGMDTVGGVGLDGMPAGDVALIPSLTLASLAGEDEPPESANRRVNDAVQAVRQLAAAGRPLVFGTGAGYVPDYDPAGEFALLDEAGVDFLQLLNALTMEPAQRFDQGYTGVVEPGMAADLVLVEGDPASDHTALERVRWVLVDGRTAYSALQAR